MITKDEFKLIDRVNKRVIISTPEIIEKEFKVKLRFYNKLSQFLLVIYI